MKPEDAFVHAIAMVESTDNPNVPLGDHGRAAGRFQQHPFFTYRWSPFGPMRVKLSTDERAEMQHNPTQDAVQGMALRLFFRFAPPNKSLPDIAVAYHLHGAHDYTGDDPVYRAKIVSVL